MNRKTALLPLPDADMGGITKDNVRDLSFGTISIEEKNGYPVEFAHCAPAPASTYDLSIW
jgi:hypothetical protein